MKKQIEIDFKDDFVPPDKFSNRKGTKCEGCPFFVSYDCDDTCLLLEWKEAYNRIVLIEWDCPIRKYFDSTDGEGTK